MEVFRLEFVSDLPDERLVPIPDDNFTIITASFPSRHGQGEVKPDDNELVHSECRIGSNKQKKPGTVNKQETQRIR